MTDTSALHTTTATVWPGLAYRDARAAIRFLVEAFGFTERICVGEGEVVEHAELGWPGGGVIMVHSSARSEDDVFGRNVGVSNTYCITDEPDALFERATTAGAEVVRPLRDEDYGSRGFAVSDPEGNVWGFGTYRG